MVHRCLPPTGRTTMQDFFANPLIGFTETRLGWMFYPRGDRYIGPSLEHYGEYARLEFEIFRLAVRPGDTVVDAGANIGAHTVLFSKLAGATGRVVAFEPQRPIFQILNANLMVNGCENVEAWPVCAGAAPGSLSFPKVSLSTRRNFGGVSAVSTVDERTVVEVRSIDELNLPSCSFIKVDVEGAEASVIAGARRTITDHRPLLCIEADSKDPDRDVKPWLDELLGLGYSAYVMVTLLYVRGNWKKNPENIFGRTINLNILAFAGAPSPWAENPQFGLKPIRSYEDFRERTAKSPR